MSICPDVASRTAKATLKKSFGKHLLDRLLAEEDERLRSYEAASACANLADPSVLVCERVRAAGPSPLALGLGCAAALLVPADTRERVRLAGPS